MVLPYGYGQSVSLASGVTMSHLSGRPLYRPGAYIGGTVEWEFLPRWAISGGGEWEQRGFITSTHRYRVQFFQIPLALHIRPGKEEGMVSIFLGYYLGRGLSIGRREEKGADLEQLQFGDHANTLRHQDHGIRIGFTAKLYSRLNLKGEYRSGFLQDSSHGWRLNSFRFGLTYAIWIRKRTSQ